MTAFSDLPSSYTLVLAPADERDPDPAELTRVGQQLTTELKRDGWKITPTYTGQRGGVELLFQVVHQVVQTAQVVDMQVMSHQAEIDVVAALTSTFAILFPVVRHLFQTHHPPSAGQKDTNDAPLTVTITVDGASIAISSADAATDERARQLAEHFLKHHPTVTVTATSAVTVRARVPKRKQQRRR